MKESKLKALFNEHKTKLLEWPGVCHDCKKETQVLAALMPDGQITVTGGAVYDPDGCDAFFIKCDGCFERDHTLRNYRPTEVYSRVVGYLRPVEQWNRAKKTEFHMRKNFSTPAEVTAQ